MLVTARTSRLDEVEAVMGRLARAALLGLAALATGASDRPRGEPARAAAWWGRPAVAARGAVAADLLPSFVLFGWCVPPTDSMTPEHMQEYRDAGLDALHLPCEESWTYALNARRLEAAAGVGLRCWVWEESLAVPDPATPQGAEALDSMVARYAGRPGFMGFSLGDELTEDLFPFFGRLARELRARAPGHPTFNDLLGLAAFPTRERFVAYVDSFLNSMDPPFLCSNYYPFLKGGDRPGFVEQLALLGDLARSRGIPWLEIIQLTAHWEYRPITEGELRWQAAHVVAYGGRGVGYFTYWTPPPIPGVVWDEGMIARDGSRTRYYDWVRALNRELEPVGRRLSRAVWLAAEHAGSVPQGGAAFAPGPLIRAVEGRAALGYFADPGGRALVLVVNSDSSAARAVRLRVPSGARVQRWEPELGAFAPLSVPLGVVSLHLPAGGFALLGFPSADAGLGERAGRPGLAVQPNPAAGRVRFQVTGAVGAARLEVLDIGGRRWWSAHGGAGASAWEWSGEGPAGRAPAGLYLVRVEDARGVTARKLAWRPTG